MRQNKIISSNPEGAGKPGVGTRMSGILVLRPNVFLAKWSSKIPERQTAQEKPWAQPQVARFSCLLLVTDSGTARKAEGGHTNIQRLCPALRATAPGVLLCQILISLHSDRIDKLV